MTKHAELAKKQNDLELKEVNCNQKLLSTINDLSDMNQRIQELKAATEFIQILTAIVEGKEKKQ